MKKYWTKCKIHAIIIFAVVHMHGSEDGRMIQNPHIRCVAQLGRALRSGRRGRRFKSCRIDSLQKAAGMRSNIDAWLSLVEHYVRDVGVAGSNPVASTTSKQCEQSRCHALSTKGWELPLGEKPEGLRCGIASAVYMIT